MSSRDGERYPLSGHVFHRSPDASSIRHPFARTLAVGAFVAGRWLAAKCKRDWVQILPGVALVLSYRIFSQPFRSWFWTYPVEPVKEAVLAIRGTLDPNDPRHNDRLTGAPP